MLSRFQLACVFVAFAGAATVAQASNLCAKWAGAKPAGNLNARLIDESSGIAFSKSHGVLYHINDSGADAKFFISRKDGTGTIAVEIDGKKPRDTEAIGLGPCPSGGASCIAVGDIGDNKKVRKNIEVFFIEEQPNFPSKVIPVVRVKLVYPDRAHNAEAMEILPNGDLVIVTKEEPSFGQSSVAFVFRARKQELTSTKNITLTKIGEIDLPSLMKNKGFGGLATAMTVSSDGKRFALLTYQNAIEFAIDLSLEKPDFSKMVEGADYRVVTLVPLTQQESMTYDQNDRDLIYATEALQRVFPRDSGAPMMKVSCIP